ncbi:MAG: DNA topoisomerase (ATP-hydrolyzing) subunit A [Eubacteriales bacterium]|nr:DNA topoisomerase (ATP-hydrolyzing) subunit A [Eubacteriales bacterium]
MQENSLNKPIEQKIADTLEKNYMPYAMSVIVSRAIPEIDGFKPSHRKLLYTMYEMKLLTGPRTKSANVVGQTMKLNPHGDMAIYETLVRLTRGNEAMLHPYIDSKGNFGKQYSRDMQFAAPRYTEVKLEKLCEEIFRDIGKDTVDFMDNYDGTIKEPVLLPVTFPGILVNVNQGIAVGMASSICSFNLREVCEAAAAYIENKATDISQYLKAPDFSSGGRLLYDEKELKQIYDTGRGGVKLRARYRYDKANSCIEIFEIPYVSSAEAIIDQIADLVKSGKIREITDIRDETDLNGLKITVDIRKNADPDGIMEKLFRLTSLQDVFSCNFNILIHGRPKVMGIREILQEWTAFRIGCVRRQLGYDIARKKEKLHLLLGLERILLDIDKAIKIVRGTEKDSMVVPNLMEGFGIDRIQAEYVAEIKLRNLNREYIIERTGEISVLKGDIAGLEDQLGNERKIKKGIIRQLKEIAAKYGSPRRTEIIYEEEYQEPDEGSLIEDYNLKIFLTKEGYLKKIALTSLRAGPEHKLKESDIILQEIDSHNKADLLLFSDRQTVYKMKIYDIEDSKASSLGDYLNNLLQLDKDEKIIYIVATDDYKGWMLFAFENGKMAKIEMSGYETKTNRKKLANAYYGKSALAGIFYLREDVELAAVSSINKVLIFNTGSINPKATRSSQGVQVMTAKKKSLLSSVKRPDEMKIAEPAYYRTKSLPATGSYLKKCDSADKTEQVTLDEINN